MDLLRCLWYHHGECDWDNMHPTVKDVKNAIFPRPPQRFTVWMMKKIANFFYVACDQMWITKKNWRMTVSTQHHLHLLCTTVSKSNIFTVPMKKPWQIPSKKWSPIHIELIVQYCCHRSWSMDKSYRSTFSFHIYWLATAAQFNTAETLTSKRIQLINSVEQKP